MLQGDEAGEVFAALNEELVGAAEALGALARRAGGPRGLCALGTLKSLGGIALARRGDLGEGALVSRIDDRKALAVGAVAPSAVDVELVVHGGQRLGEAAGDGKEHGGAAGGCLPLARNSGYSKRQGGGRAASASFGTTQGGSRP